MVLCFRYCWFSWSPPVQTAQEQIETGEQVALLGKAYFRDSFRPKTGEGSLTTEQRARREKFQRLPKWLQRVCQLGILLAFLGSLVLMPFLIAPAIFILVIGLGSYSLAVFRHNRWLDRCLAAYARASASTSALGHIGPH